MLRRKECVLMNFTVHMDDWLLVPPYSARSYFSWHISLQLHEINLPSSSMVLLNLVYELK